MSWLTISQTSGEGDAEITLSASSHTELEQRVASLKVYGQKAYAIETVTQAPPVNIGELLYTTTDGSIVEPDTTNWDVAIISNTYEDGIGRIKVNDTLTEIPSYSFSSVHTNVEKLTSVIMPDSVTRIGNGAFNNCKALSSVTISANIEYCGEGAFIGCPCVEYTDNVAYVGTIATGMTSSTTSSITCVIKEGTRVVASSFYRGTNYVTGLSLPETLVGIGLYSFSGFDALTEVTLPKNLKFLGGGAFKGCTGLTKVYIEGNNFSIGPYAISNPFINCKNAYFYGEGVSEDHVYAITSKGVLYGFNYDRRFYEITDEKVVETLEYLHLPTDCLILPNSVKTIRQFGYGPTSSTVFVGSGVTLIDSYYLMTNGGRIVFENPTPPSTTDDFPQIISSGTIVTPTGAKKAYVNVVGASTMIEDSDYTIVYDMSDDELDEFNSQTIYVASASSWKLSKAGDDYFPSISQESGGRGIHTITLNYNKSEDDIPINKGKETATTVVTLYKGNDFYVTKATYTEEKYYFWTASKKTYLKFANSLGKTPPLSEIFGSFTLPEGYPTYNWVSNTDNLYFTETSGPNYYIYMHSNLYGATTTNNIVNVNLSSSHTVTVTIGPTNPVPTISLDKSAITMDREYSLSQVKYVTITSETPWTASSEQTWIVPSDVPDYGAWAGPSGSTTRAIFCETNDEGSERIGYIKYTNSDGYTIKLTITQFGMDDAIKVTYTSTDGEVVTPSSSSGITSNTYEDGVGTIAFSDASNVGSLSFNTCETLATITFPSVSVALTKYAFQYCTSLTTADLGGVTEIGGTAFYGCSALTSISLPNVTTIGDDAFYNCSALTSVTIPNVTTIGASAFYGCDGLTSIELPAVTSIGASAFYNCSALTSIGLPLITSIGDDAFYNCISLESIDLSSVTSMGESTFKNCEALEEVTLNDALTSIPTETFEFCSALTTINMDMSNILTIGDYAFYGCDGLTSIELPAVTSIGASAFKYCYGLTKVVLGGNVTLKESAFYNCSALTYMDLGNLVSLTGKSIYCPSLSTIYVRNSTAPSIEYDLKVASTGTLYYPKGADYSSWLTKFGSGWTGQEIES